MGRRLTITPEDAVNVMRKLGIKISTPTLKNGIEQGVFNFGVHIRNDSNVYFIWRNQFEEWLKTIGVENINEIYGGNE